MRKGFYVIGKMCAKVGAGLLLWLWLDETFCKKEDCGTKKINGKVSLIIDDKNVGDYVAEHPVYKTSNVLTIPNDVDIIMVETTKNLSLHNIMPQSGEFDNGKEIKIGGNVSFYMPSEVNEEYQFSPHIYQDMTTNNGGIDMKSKNNNMAEMTCWRKIWWFDI